MNQSDPNKPTISDTKKFFREWLERLQQESWQLELIISGFALFGVYSAKGLIVDWKLLFLTHDANPVLAAFWFLPETGWRIFFINLLLHVILRALWIGSIGLRYVSSEIDYDNLNYSPFFTEFLKRKVGDYDDFIEKLEKICSILFSFTFLLFLLSVSFAFVLAAFILPFNLIESLNVKNQATIGFIGITWFIVYWTIALIVFFDFVTAGKLKKVKDRGFNRFYKIIYQIFSVISLTIFYRPLLYNFLDNRYTRRLFYFSFVYVAIIAFSTSLVSYRFSAYNSVNEEDLTLGYYAPRSYIDEYQKKLSTLDLDQQKAYILDHRSAVRLSSRVLSDGYASIYLGDFNHRADKLLKNKYDLDKLYNKGLLFFWEKERIQTDYERALSDELDLKLDEIAEQRREIRRSMRQVEEGGARYAELEVQLDSFRTLRTDVMEASEMNRDEYKKEQDEKILNTYKELFDVRVDTQPINDLLSCRYYYDSQMYDRGLLCYFPTDSIALGLHDMVIKKTIRIAQNNEDLIYKTYRIPFIKE